MIGLFLKTWPGQTGRVFTIILMEHSMYLYLLQSEGFPNFFVKANSMTEAKTKVDKGWKVEADKQKYFANLKVTQVTMKLLMAIVPDEFKITKGTDC